MHTIYTINLPIVEPGNQTATNDRRQNVTCPRVGSISASGGVAEFGRSVQRTRECRWSITTETTMKSCGMAGRRLTENNMLVMVILAVIGTMTAVESAAVVDNTDWQQLMPPNSGESSESSSGCEDGRLINCRTLPLFNYTDLAPPLVGGGTSNVNSDILQDDNCPYKNFERHLRCVDVFTRRCLTTDQRAAFYKLYSVPTLAMQELCTEGGPYREEYMKHAACLRTVHAQYVQCGNKHQYELAALMEQDHSSRQSHQDMSNVSLKSTVSPFGGPEQITQNLIHLCGSFKGHLQCVNGIVRAHCGPQTEEFASQFLGQMASSLLNICKRFGNTDGDISSSTSSGNRLDATGLFKVLTALAAVGIFASRWQR